MALLHSRTVDGVRYEVRTAGHSRRLYTNGAFHTQYNPRHLFTGAVWDLLSLPFLCLDEPARRALVLGVGGGTVIHQLNTFQPGIRVTGVELDATHIALAKGYFDLDYPRLQLATADAFAWLKKSRSRFDYIVDDVFLHGESDPERPFAADGDWSRLLVQHLSPGGMLVQNHTSAAHARQAARTLPRGVLVGFETEGYENRVIAWTRRGSAGNLQRRLDAALAALQPGQVRRLRHRLVTVRR